MQTDSFRPGPKIQSTPARHNNIESVHKINPGMINAYLDDRLSTKQREFFETQIANDKRMMKLLDKKEQERYYMLQLIPEVSPQVNNLAQMRREIKDLNDSVLKDRNISWWTKVWDWLNTPFAEIKY
jgi:hypothetical protein